MRFLGLCKYNYNCELRSLGVFRLTTVTPAAIATPKNSLPRAKATTSGPTARRKVATPSVAPKRKGGTASTANLSDDSDVNEDDTEFESPPKPGKHFNHFQMNHNHHQQQTHHQTHNQQQLLGLGSTSSSQKPRGFAPSVDGGSGFSFIPTTTTTTTNNNQFLSSSLYHSSNLSHPNGTTSLVSPSFSSIAHHASALSSQPTTSRMSKEKQQFFRHSAFNSDRPHKVSPPAATNVRLGQTHLDITHSSTSDSDKSSDEKPTPAKPPAKSSHKIAEMPPRISATNLSESSSSCSSSEDDDDDDSTSGTSSTTSSTNSTSSSSNSSSNSTDSDESGKTTTTTAKSKKPTTPAPPQSENRSTAQAASGNHQHRKVANSRSSSSSSMTIQTAASMHFPTSKSAAESAAAVASSSSSAWGFAAEAKKSVDIFRKTAEVANERVFGNFDGIDKDSLVVKTTIDRNSLIGLNNNNKTTGQLKGLFDSLSHVFSTTDYTRSRPNAPSTYKSVDRRRKPKEIPIPKEVLKETRSTFKDFKEQQRRMSTMGQKIGVPSPDFSSFQPPKHNLLPNRFPVVGKSFFTPNSTSIVTKQSAFLAPTQLMPTPKTQPSKVVARRRTTATILPMEPSRRRRYDSSSEDEVQHIFGHNNNNIPPRMTPSNLVKNAINCQSQQTRQHIRSQHSNGGGMNGGPGTSRPGSPTATNSSGLFIQTNSSSGLGGVAYPKPSSTYSQSQFMGKNALPKQPIN